MDRHKLYEFFRGEASPALRREVLEWVEAGEQNMKVYLQERMVFDSLIVAGPDTGQRRVGSGIKFRGSRLWKVAALVAVIFGTALYMIYDRVTEQQFALVNVPASQRTEVVLPDGTKVWLNGMSSLEYPSSFDRKERRVKVTGEAFFEVTHDAAHPFIVETLMCDVEVLGTEFNVEAYDQSGVFRAWLVGGKVMVYNKMVPGDAVMLEPDQMAEMQGTGRLMKSDIPSHENFLWREGLIAFRDASFEQIMKLFEKYYDVNIVMEGKIPGNTFTGKIPVKSGLDHGFWLLQQNATFSYRKDADFKTVYIY